MTRASHGMGLTLVGILAAAMLVAPLGLAVRSAALRLVQARPIHSCDLMVILRGGALERMATGVELHADGACERVMISGDQTGEGIPQIRTILRNLDPRDRIGPVTASSSTLGDALQAYEAARHGGFRRLLVVTSPYHTKRAIWAFSRVLAGTGIEFGVVPSEVHHMDYGRWWEGSHGREAVSSEYAKLWLYGLAAQILMSDATLAAGARGLP